MKIHYIIAAPKPKVEGTDALYNEVGKLATHFQTNYTVIAPTKLPITWIQGLEKINKIKRLDSQVDLHHIFAPGLSYFPVLHGLRKPIVYTIAGAQNRLPYIVPSGYLSHIQTFVTSVSSTAEALASRLPHIEIIESGIVTSKINRSSLPLTGRLHLLMASAPWTLEQFETKGIHLILKALKVLPKVQITFLWRGLFLDEMEALIRKSGLENQVRIINKKIDINHILSQVHGTILVSNNPLHIKSMPHSLIESITAGKPIITSESIGLNHLINEYQCGLVLKNFSSQELKSTIENFIANYTELSNHTVAVPEDRFSFYNQIQSYEKLYRTILKQ